MSRSPFFIDEQARHALLTLSRESGYGEPVAIISETADVTSDLGLRKLGKELMTGTRSAEQLAPIARDRLADIAGDLHFQMHIEVRDRKSVASEQTQSVSGILFIMTPHLLEMLNGYHLTYQGERFSLRDSNDVERSLQYVVGNEAGSAPTL